MTKPLLYQERTARFRRASGGGYNERAVVRQLVVLTVNEKLRNKSIIYHTFICGFQIFGLTLP